MPNGALAVPDDIYYANIDISSYVAAVTGTAGVAAGLAFRIAAGDRFYLAEASASAGELRLSRVSPGSVAVLDRAPVDIRPGVWSLLRARAFGSAIEVTLDDKATLRAADAALGWGRIGAWSPNNAVACFDELAAAPR